MASRSPAVYHYLSEQVHAFSTPSFPIVDSYILSPTLAFCLTYLLAKNCRPFFWLVRDYNIRHKNPPVFFISQNVVPTKLLRKVWDDDRLDRAQLPSASVRPVPAKYSQITSALLISTRYFLTLGM